MKTKPGDIVAYRSWDGTRRICKVIQSCENVKNGRPGFDGVLLPESDAYDPNWPEVWGYDDQIVAINNEAPR